MRTEKFDMEACLKEKSRHHSIEAKPERDFHLSACIRISGAESLSKFGTRVVLNEVLHGKTKEAAISKALELQAKKGE